MVYNFRDIEQKWQRFWQENQIYKVTNDLSQPKYYVLDMFPYPSGAGLHVGHPLGYIASDIVGRYKRHRGYNVLHPMGFDAFGLPAEQYALETGQHPAVTTEKNIARYREQLNNIGFSYDWSREVVTSDPSYYKWTQWIFLQLFESWFDRKLNKARPISQLIEVFEKEGNANYASPHDAALSFTKEQWKAMSLEQQRQTLMGYRLAYLADAEVWWCEALGTVLANDEVVNGVSERGGHPVVKKTMRQWFLRITEYAERLLESLQGLEWTDAMKEMQRNWIGKSTGASVQFDIKNHDEVIEVFTTRPDTIFGVDFIVLAPEHPLVGQIATDEYQQQVAEYKLYVQSRSERERQAEVKQITGCFTGAYAIHPFSRKQLPIWISEYVLAGYGTGAIMAVPSGDERDHAFAQNFSLPVTNIFGGLYTGEAAYTQKAGTLEGSDFLTGLEISKAHDAAIRAIVDAGIGKPKVQYRLRDAGFSRQRYWGEPFPVIYNNEIPYSIKEATLTLPEEERELPVKLPHVDTYGPGPEGQGPLANIRDWVETPAGQRETNTMPGYAGSSWYFLRYMDPHNEQEFVSAEAAAYWNQVDVYIGGTEHAVGHLLYARMWTKVLNDLGFIPFDEPFKRLVNQGMIQGQSFFALAFDNGKEILSVELAEQLSPEQQRHLTERRVPVEYVDGGHLKPEKWAAFQKEFSLEGYHFRPNEAGEIRLKSAVEKMSKSKRNVINPDHVVEQYGADTFRMYEMFLGPLDVSKPWDMQGIEGVHRFLKKLWRLYYNDSGWAVTEEAPSEEALRVIHKTIKKTGDDIERFSLNTAVSHFMICVNELTALKCHNRTVLEALAVLISPFAPHLAEELWAAFGHESSVTMAPWPAYEEKYLSDAMVSYPVAVNGKTRHVMTFPQDATQSFIEGEVLADATVQKYLDGKAPKKIIFVKGRMVNVVV